MNGNNDKVVNAGEVGPEFAERRTGHVSRRDRRQGSALGGVVHGLEVHAIPGASNLLQIEAGLAISGNGEPLALDNPLRLRLAPGVGETGFAMDQGEGYYLISLAPAAGPSGEQAQEIGSKARLIAHGTRWRKDDLGVRIDRIPATALPTTLRGTPPADPAASSRARSLLAKLCLGKTPDSTSRGRPPDDLLQTAGFATAERVALAVVAWSNEGVRFIDRWAVRRDAAPDRHRPYTARAEAMRRQFQEHLDELLLTLKSTGSDAASLVAGEWFAWLPAVGILPRADTESGLSAKVFFSTLPARSLFLAHAELESILRDGMACPPIDLTAAAPQPVWLYQLFEDRKVLVYASGHLPPVNPAQLDLARYDAALYPDGEQ
ncbi:MAG: hypothetical protein QM739_10140 [Propionivibrio sp.]